MQPCWKPACAPTRYSCQRTERPLQPLWVGRVHHVDYLLYATVTTGTTDRNNSSQRDYEITLEMVNMHSGEFLKESARIRKGYSKNRTGKCWNYGWFDQADG